MPIPVDQGPLLPPFRWPYKYGVVDYALSKRPLDSHAWLPGPDGGVIVGPNVICVPVAEPYDAACPPAEVIKSTPIIGIRDNVTAFPQYFEIALQESTLSCPDLTPLARQSLKATLEHAVENETLISLVGSASVHPVAPTSALCALSEAVQVASSVLDADGIALITIPPALAAYALGTHFLKEDAQGHLVDAFGNWYRVLRDPFANAIFVEFEATSEVWFSDPVIDELSIPRDAQRDSNTVIIRAEGAYIYVQDRCAAIRINYTCE